MWYIYVYTKINAYKLQYDILYQNVNNFQQQVTFAMKYVYKN